MKKYFTIFALGMMALSTAAFAATTATNTNTVSPTLQISATIQSAVQLTLSTGTAAVTHCAVTPGTGTDYAMSFGTVDALAINNGACNKFAPTTPGVTNAIYWSDYNSDSGFHQPGCKRRLIHHRESDSLILPLRMILQSFVIALTPPQCQPALHLSRLSALQPLTRLPPRL